MDKLLHIIATPRGKDSRTLRVSEAFLESFKKKYPNCKIDNLDLFTEILPPLTARRIDGKYVLLSGQDLPNDLEGAWRDILQYIKGFLSADAYLLSTPMWNFSIPYILKHYIDIIVQPKYLFRYAPSGPEGLAKGKKMVVITSRGGDYSLHSQFHSYDYQEPYLRSIFGFVGIKDISFINVQPMDALGPQVQREKIVEAQVQAKVTAENF